MGTKYRRTRTNLTEAGQMARAIVLHRAAKKRPLRLYQYDAFYMPDGGDSVMHPNEDGWALMGGQTVELFNGGWDVRVLVPPRMFNSSASVSKALRAIADWIEHEPLKNLGPWIAAHPEGKGFGREAFEQTITEAVEFYPDMEPPAEGCGVVRIETISDGVSEAEVTLDKKEDSFCI